MLDAIQLLTTKAFGMANLEAWEQMRKDSLVCIDSMSKPVPSVGLLTAHEQGKFS